MNLYDSLWIGMSMYDYGRLCMTKYGFVWMFECKTIYDFVWLWLYTTIYIYAWLCIAIHEYACLCMYCLILIAQFYSTIFEFAGIYLTLYDFV